MPSPDGADRRARLRISNAQTCPRWCAGALCRAGALYRQDDPDRRWPAERIAAMNCRPPHGRSAGAIVGTGCDRPIAGSRRADARASGRSPSIFLSEPSVDPTAPVAEACMDGLRAGAGPLRRHRPRPFGRRPRPGGRDLARLPTRSAIGPTGYRPDPTGSASGRFESAGFQRRDTIPARAFPLRMETSDRSGNAPESPA